MKYFVDSCPVSGSVSPFGLKWLFALLVELSRGPSGFCSLKKSLSPVTSRVLSSCLKRAILVSCVERVSDRYLLTARGLKLISVLRNFSNKDFCSSCRGAGFCVSRGISF